MTCNYIDNLKQQIELDLVEGSDTIVAPFTMLKIRKGNRYSSSLQNIYISNTHLFFKGHIEAIKMQ